MNLKKIEDYFLDRKKSANNDEFQLKPFNKHRSTSNSFILKRLQQKLSFSPKLVSPSLKLRKGDFATIAQLTEQKAKTVQESLITEHLEEIDSMDSLISSLPNNQKKIRKFRAYTVGYSLISNLLNWSFFAKNPNKSFKKPFKNKENFLTEKISIVKKTYTKKLYPQTKIEKRRLAHIKRKAKNSFTNPLIQKAPLVISKKLLPLRTRLSICLLKLSKKYKRLINKKHNLLRKKRLLNKIRKKHRKKIEYNQHYFFSQKKNNWISPQTLIQKEDIRTVISKKCRF